MCNFLKSLPQKLLKILELINLSKINIQIKANIYFLNFK